MLSCSCREWDGNGIGYTIPYDFTNLNTSKRKRCTSCCILIDIGSPVLLFSRFRATRTEVEVNIYGEDGKVKLCNHYLCDKCGEIYLNLDVLGYCLDPRKDMTEYLLEYHEMTNFNK